MVMSIHGSVKNWVLCDSFVSNAILEYSVSQKQTIHKFYSKVGIIILNLYYLLLLLFCTEMIVFILGSFQCYIVHLFQCKFPILI